MNKRASSAAPENSLRAAYQTIPPSEEDWDNASRAGAPEGTPELSSGFIRQALLGEVPIPADSPLKIDGRGARMEGAIVEGDLDLSGFVFDRPIAFERCTFLGAIDLSQSTLVRFSLAGSRATSLKAHAAVLRGDLCLSAMRIDSPHRNAIEMNGTSVAGTVQMNGAVVDGNVQFLDMDIAGSLNCDDLRIRNAVWRPWDFDNSGAALNCTRTRIARDVLLSDSSIEGMTSFAATHIGGNVLIVGTSLSTDTDKVALNFSNARIAAAFILSRAPAFKGILRLRGTRAESFGDDGSSWQRTADGAVSSTLELDQFHYELFLDAVIVRTDTSWRTRLAWIKAQSKELWTSDFRPQPFTRVAEVLQNMGDAHGARMILFERERMRLKAKHVGLWEKLGGHLLGALAGYGYKSHYALYWALGVWLIGALVFGTADRLGQLRPADPHVIAEEHYQETLHPPTDYEPVNPLLYSADILLPIVELGQQEYWIPRNAGERAANAAAAFPQLRAPCANAASFSPPVHGGSGRAAAEGRRVIRLPATQHPPSVTLARDTSPVNGGGQESTAAGAGNTVRPMCPDSPLVRTLNWAFGGWLPKGYYYFEIAMGWLLVSIVIAGFSGLIGHAREE